MDIDLRFIRRYAPPVPPPPGGPTWEAYCLSLADESVSPPSGLTKKQLHAWIIAHPVWFANRFLRLRIEGGKTVQIAIDDVQFILLATIWWYLFVCHVPLVMPVLKGRRARVSVGVSVAIYILTRMDSGKHALLVSVDDDKAMRIFRDTYASYEINLPKRKSLQIKTLHASRNPQKLSWCRLVDVTRTAPDGTRVEESVLVETGGSIIEQMSAMTPSGFAGGGLDFIHYSEMGFDGPDWDRIRTITAECLPRESPYFFEIFESTGDTIGTYFQKLWDKAQEAESAMYPLFVPWYDSKVCRRRLPPGAVVEPVGSNLSEKAADGREIVRIREAITADWKIAEERDPIERAHLEKAREEALQWRAVHRREKELSVERFNWLNPTVPADAFLAPGQSVFDGVALDRMTRWTRERELAVLQAKPRPKYPKKSERVEGLTYIHPAAADGWYFLAADGSLGTADGDEASLAVWNLRPAKGETKAKMRLEAIWHGRRPEGVQERLAAELAQAYRTERRASLWAMESNDKGGDRAIQIRIRRNAGAAVKLPMYRAKPIVQKYTREIPPYGFSTNARTRVLAIASFREMVEEGAIEIEYLPMLAQMRNFGTDGTGKIRGQKGVSDDLVTVGWIGSYYAWEQGVHTLRADRDALLAAADAEDMEVLGTLGDEIERTDEVREAEAKARHPHFGKNLVAQVVAEEKAGGISGEPFFRERGGSGDWRLGYTGRAG